jgi:sterol 24-C-methyltransferase
MASMNEVNDWAAIPTNQLSYRVYSKDCWRMPGVIPNVEVQDYLKNIGPMLQFFYVLVIVPYDLIKLRQLEKFFVNTLAGARGYIAQEHWQ